MKKRLVAAALASCLPIYGHAQTNVTMFGVADAAVGYLSGDTLTAAGPRTGGAFQVQSGIQSGSRWGIRGTEDLGGGLSAFFVAIAGWNVDTGTGKATGGGLSFNRASSVGINGSLGQVYLGRNDSPSFFMFLANDIGGMGMWAMTGGYLLQLGASRYSNAVFYNSPNLGGLQIRAAVGGAGDVEYDVSPKGRDRNLEVAALYEAGPVKLNSYVRYGNANDVTAAGGARKIKQGAVGGGYNFGSVRLIGMAAGTWPDRDVNSLVSATGAQNPTFDRSVMASIGLGVRAGAGEIMLQAWQARFDVPAAGTPGANGSKPKSTFASFNYTYPLSTRTNLYTSYGFGKNSNGASLAMLAGDFSATSPAGGPVGNQNARMQALSFGIRHLF